MPYKKKLIKIALPLETINAESSREKSIRHGHPSTLHSSCGGSCQWIAPLVWASLVDACQLCLSNQVIRGKDLIANPCIAATYKRLLLDKQNRYKDC